MRKTKEYISLEDFPWIPAGTVGVEKKFSKPKEFVFQNSARTMSKTFTESFIRRHPHLFLRVWEKEKP